VDDKALIARLRAILAPLLDEPYHGYSTDAYDNMLSACVFCDEEDAHAPSCPVREADALLGRPLTCTAVPHLPHDWRLHRVGNTTIHDAVCSHCGTMVPLAELPARELADLATDSLRWGVPAHP